MAEKLRQYGRLHLNQRSVLILLLLLLGLYLHGASLQNHLVNTLPRTDQRAYLNTAKQLHESGYNYLVPRNRMPIYPLLQSLVYKPGMSDETFFTLGKDSNVILSLFILAAFYWLCQRFFSPLQTLILMLITGFTVFMFKAPFFQAELLFYFLNLTAFLLALKMFREPTAPLGIITGLVFGIAHMTKASVIPGLLLFSVFMGIGIMVDFLNRTPYRNVLRQKALPLFLLLLAFLISISVYISNSKKLYGHYFYNVNSTFYIWYDNWPQAEAGTIAHGDREGWPDLPDEEIPGPIKYLREHSLGQIIGRIWVGLLGVLFNTLLSYGYFIYFALYTVLFFTLAVLNWRPCLAKVKQHYLLVLFTCSYFLLHLLAVAWYTPIASGNRFILAYFLPYMFVLFYVFRSAEKYFGVQANRFLNIVNILVLCGLAGHIYYIMTARISAFYGGL